ncbi:hypothetical protein [Halorientalis halophila]|uniref:hypothetical protein n=1 Tax=Halorientalis halophila TaxID=3108499 RepID=UPI003009ACA6
MAAERPERADLFFLAAGTGIVLGAIVVVIAGSAGQPSVGGLGLNRIGQFLFAAGFGFGALYHRVLGHGLQVAGFSLLAAGWALLFADWLLVPLLGRGLFTLIIAVLALGGALVVLGIIGDAERLREAVPPGVRPGD